MSDPEKHGDVDSYVQAAIGQVGSRDTLDVEELQWLLSSSFELNTLRLGFLTALQRALAVRDDEAEPASGRDTVRQLKGLLTNVTIMQTRLNEHEASLVELLRQAAGAGLVQPVEVQAEDLRSWVEAVLDACEHISGRAPA